MSPAKTLAAGLVAASLAITPAQATTATKNKDVGLIFLGAITLGALALLLTTQMSGNDGFRFSSKDIKGTDGNLLPQSPSAANTTVLMDF